jgi:hypothetical protein
VTDRRVTARLFAILATPWLVLIVRSWWLADDAYIAFRYARNWSMGRGLRYNLGEPVEGFSEFLWVAVAAVAEKLRLGPETVTPVVSVGCGLAVLWLVLSIALRLPSPSSQATTRGLGEAAAGVAGLLFVALPTTSVWATGGLGTMLHTLLLLAAVDLLCFRPDSARRDALLAVVGAALVLSRVEGPAWVLVAAAAAVVARLGTGRPLARPLLAFLSSALATFAIYEIWRIRMYHELVANTVSAKVDPGLSSWLRGGRYAASFFLTPITPILAIPAALLARRRDTLVLAVPVLGTVAYVVLAGSDFMSHFRLMLPATPFLALLVGQGVAALTARYRARAAAIVATVAVVAALGVLPAFDVHLLPREIRARHDGTRLLDPEAAERAVRTEQEHWLKMRQRTEDGVILGRALRRELPRDASFVASAIGAVGYHSRLQIIDRNGLVEKFDPRVERAFREGHLPGHEHTLPLGQTLRRKPTVLVARVLEGENVCRRAKAFLEPLAIPDYAPVLTPTIGSRWLAMIRRSDDPLRDEAAFEEACADAGPAAP